MIKLKPCPFCGKETAEVTNLQECEMCANFEQEDFCPGFEEPGACGALVVCNHQKGGCGAATGWHQFPEEAIEAWNKRLEETVKPTKCPCGELFDAKDSSFCPKCGCAYGELSGRYTNIGR